MDKEKQTTKEKLLTEAKIEFFEKGFSGASLRSICKKAGVTTGALYFFFKDKDDLFSAIVQKPLDLLYPSMKAHFDEELENESLPVSDSSDDLEVARTTLDLLYTHEDEFRLLLTKSQGSKYENCVDEFIDIADQHYRKLAKVCAKKYKVDEIDDFTIHWISHMQINTFCQFLEHGVTRDEALKQLNVMVRFMVNGWRSMFGEHDCEMFHT